MKRFWICAFKVILVAGVMACEGPVDRGPVYVIATVLNLRQLATTDSRVLTRLERGEELVVEERLDPWVRVTTGQGVTGWVHGDFVGSPEAARRAYQSDLSRTTRPGRPEQTLPPAADNGAEVDSYRLNLSAEQLLAGVEPGFDLEELGPIDGEARSRGVADDGHLVVEFHGDLQNVTRASMMVAVEDLTDEQRRHNAAAALRFVKNAIPNWKRDVDWMVERLEAFSKVDSGRGEVPSGRIRATMDQMKPLGAVKFTIEVIP